MSLDVNLYRNRLEAYKIGGKDGKIDSIKQQILDDFIKNPSYFKVNINDEIQDVHIVADNQGRSRLLCKPGEIIMAGSYIEWDGKFYLCTHVDNDASIQCKGTIQPCNYKLKWLNKHGKLIERQSIVSAKTLYTTGVRNEKVIEIPDGMVGIQLPYDDDTKELVRGIGFVFNKTKYRITFYNDVEYDGLIILICDEVGIDTSVDDTENRIADRWLNGIDRWIIDENGSDDKKPEEPDEWIITYSIDGNDSIYWNDIQTYVVRKFDSGIQTEATFDFALSNDYADIASYTDSTVDIKAKSGIQYKYVTLTATDTDNGEHISKQILIKGLI